MKIRIAALVLFKIMWLAIYAFFFWHRQEIIGAAPPFGLLIFAWLTYEFVAAMVTPWYHLRGSMVRFMRDHPVREGWL